MNYETVNIQRCTGTKVRHSRVQNSGSTLLNESTQKLLYRQHGESTKQSIDDARQQDGNAKRRIHKTTIWPYTIKIFTLIEQLRPTSIVDISDVKSILHLTITIYPVLK